MSLLQVSIPIEANLQYPVIELGPYTSNIVSLMLSLASLAAFLYLAWGGVQWITSGEDKAKTEAARTRITNAVIGLAIVAASWAIFLLLNYFFGLGIAGAGGGYSGNGIAGAGGGYSGNGSGGNGGGYSGNGSGGNGGGNGGSTAICIYPPSRCCDDINNSSCFCQNPNYHAVSSGGCPAGGGLTGVLCSCVPN